MQYVLYYSLLNFIKISALEGYGLYKTAYDIRMPFTIRKLLFAICKCDLA